ncbi:MAG: archaeal proteasome endopeptidase complex subunit alpha [Candidatus Pacearchaeota archaeon]
MEMEMQHQVMGYDRASTMFSPDGRILQVEYAEKTVRLGSASIGIVCEEGVIIIADKRVSDSLVVPESSMKIWEIDSHIIASAAGILSDARVLIERAQVIAQQHRVTYDEPIDTETIIKEIANIKQAYTQYGGARPFGIEAMIAGVNPNNDSKLYVSDVTGNYTGYRATAIGENDERIKELLREEYREGLNMEQAIKLALNVFKKVLGKNFNISRFEAALVKKEDKKVKRIASEMLTKYVK